MRLPPTDSSPPSKTLGPRVARADGRTRPDVGVPVREPRRSKEAGLNRLTVPTEYGGFGYWLPGNFAGSIECSSAWRTGTPTPPSCCRCTTTRPESSPGTRRRPSATDTCPRSSTVRTLASLGSEAHIYENGAENLTRSCAKVDGGLRLNARKAFASVAAIATYLMVWVAVEGDAAYAERMVFAVVPTDAPGVTLLDDWQMLGMRSTVSCSITFEDVFVPDSDVVGEPGGWINKDPRTFSCALRVQPPRHGPGRVRLHRRLHRRPRRPQLVGGGEGSTGPDGCSAVRGPQRPCAGPQRGSIAATTPTNARPTRCARCICAKNAVLDIPYEGFDIVGARAAHERYPLGQMMRDARTFTLHFRDDLYVSGSPTWRWARGFSAKKARSGSTPFDQSTPAPDALSPRCTTTPHCADRTVC